MDKKIIDEKILQPMELFMQEACSISKDGGSDK